MKRDSRIIFLLCEAGDRLGLCCLLCRGIGILYRGDSGIGEIEYVWGPDSRQATPFGSCYELAAWRRDYGVDSAVVQEEQSFRPSE